MGKRWYIHTSIKNWLFVQNGSSHAKEGEREGILALSRK
jgi:hypothetical protein